MILEKEKIRGKDSDWSNQVTCLHGLSAKPCSIKKDGSSHFQSWGDKGLSLK